YPYQEEHSDSNIQLCYAESTDGITWSKPNLGITGFNGTEDTNIIFSPEMHPDGNGLHGSNIFKDPSAPASARYKLTYMGRADNGQNVVHGAISRDGINWNLLDDPLLMENADSQTTIAWSEEKNCYVGYFRHWENGRRHITYSESDNFEKWPSSTFLIGAEAFLEPSTDYYTNGYNKWPEAPNAHLMFPTMYYRGTDEFPGDHLSVSLGFSRGGLNWQFPLDEPFIPLGGTGTGREGMVFAGSGIVELPNKSIAIPLGCCPYTHN
ncbi:unnamed protein product, partial [marine sediment metagenome]